MRLRRNDKGEYEEANEIHITPELLILNKIGLIEEELKLINSNFDLLIQKIDKLEGADNEQES